VIVLPKFVEDAINTLKPVFDAKFNEVTGRLDKIDTRLGRIEELLKKKGE